MKIIGARQLWCHLGRVPYYVSLLTVPMRDFYQLSLCLSWLIGWQSPFFGLMVRVGSYLGWLPAAGILPPANRHPWQRNLVMIVAHWVWGVSLEEAIQKLSSSD